MSDWLSDRREIVALKLGEERFDWGTGDRFERIQYPGEMAYVPWVRITTYCKDNVMTPSKRNVEAPLSKLEWIQFADLPE